MRGLKEMATLCFSPEYDEASLNPRTARKRNEKNERNWNELASVFIPLMEELEQKEDFTDEGILDTHRMSALFMHHYCTLIFLELKGSPIASICWELGTSHTTFSSAGTWPDLRSRDGRHSISC